MKVYYLKGCSENFRKIRRKTLAPGHLFDKVVSKQSATLLEIDSSTDVFLRQSSDRLKTFFCMIFPDFFPENYFSRPIPEFQITFQNFWNEYYSETEKDT